MLSHIQIKVLLILRKIELYSFHEIALDQTALCLLKDEFLPQMKENLM